MKSVLDHCNRFIISLKTGEMAYVGDTIGYLASGILYVITKIDEERIVLTQEYTNNNFTYFHGNMNQFFFLVKK